jgi:hypothetical protein
LDIPFLQIVFYLTIYFVILFWDYTLKLFLKFYVFFRTLIFVFAFPIPILAIYRIITEGITSRIMSDMSAHSIVWIMITIVYFSALFFYSDKDKLRYPYASLFLLVFVLSHELLWITNYFIYLSLHGIYYFDITLLAPYSYYALILILTIPKLGKEKIALIFALIFTLSYQEIWLFKWNFVNSGFWIPYSNFDDSLRTHIIEIFDWIGYALTSSLILIQEKKETYLKKYFFIR